MPDLMGRASAAPNHPDSPARIPAGRPRRLDPVSEAWQAGYRTLALVRPNLAGPVLGAEVEQYLTGGAA